MGKQTGHGDRLLVAGYDLSGDVGSIQNINGGPATLDVTGIDKSAYERIGGLRGGGVEFASFFNPATDKAHERLSALPTTDQIVTYLRGAGAGSPGASMVAKVLNYDGTRNEDGSFTFKVNADANGYGLEWGHQLTDGFEVQSSAGSLAGVDDGAGTDTDFGLQAYLQVLAFTGTSITVKLQDSDDDAGSDPYADITGAAFSAATAIGAQRIATGATENVKEWIRVTTTGTFSAATFVVVVVRNLTAVSF